MTNRIGVCSWSLQPTSPQDLVEKCTAVGVRLVQLALGVERHSSVPAEEIAPALREAGIAIGSGMTEMRGEDYSTLASIRRTGGVRPDATWPENQAIAKAHAKIARALGLSLVTLHAGFMPEEPNDPERPKLLDRLRSIIDIFADQGLHVAFETGQETADTLLDVLAALKRPTVGVNFDPANMILYDKGDPIDALRKLAPHVYQVHIKDAKRATRPGAWGDQTPIGAGEVDWPAFFAVLRERRLTCDLMIEREAGGTRTDDVRGARELCERMFRS